MGKIIIIGCGQGGLTAAKHLKNYGHEVSVYEAKSKETTAYPWRDDIRRASFEEAGLTPIPEEECVQKSKWKFVSPNENASLNVPMTPPLEEISISRKYLLNRLLEECEGINVYFNSPVESLIIENRKVVGIIVNGQSIKADMVVDASGLESPFRKELPAEYGFKEPCNSDIMFAFRGYYELNCNAEVPNPPCTLYVKHLGGAGISWCNYSNDNTCDVLIGRIGSLSDDDIEKCKSDLLLNHSFNSNRKIFGKKVKIALRYPSPVMIADGYAVVGDSAFMTMPFMGSGIESSMIAGKLLADAIGKECDFSAVSLYRYQQEFWKRFGNFYVFVDVIKRWALNLPAKDIDWAFNSGLVTDDDMALISTDENTKKLSFGVILRKICIAFGNFSLISRAVKYVVRGLSAQRYAKKMPKKYDRNKLAEWALKLDKKVRK